MINPIIPANGGSGGTSVHNDTTGKQGGTSGEYYHLTSAEHAALGGGGGGDVVDDLTPELGGDLDVLARSILSSTGDINIIPNGTSVAAVKTNLTLDHDGSHGYIKTLSGNLRLYGNGSMNLGAGGGLDRIILSTVSVNTYKQLRNGGTLGVAADSDIGTNSLYYNDLVMGGSVRSPVGDVTLDASAVAGSDIILTPSSTGEVKITGLTTEDFTIVDAGSTGATEQDWVEVTVGGNTGYIRVYTAK